jgi:hypothetical protein
VLRQRECPRVNHVETVAGEDDQAQCGDRHRRIGGAREGELSGAVASFRTNPVGLENLLKGCARGEIQLPDFQRSWVWDENRIKSLLASVSQAFPIGALMTQETGGEVEFKPRPIQGALPIAAEVSPRELLLDGQQRMTSL